jgi:hypothetical protein
VRLALAPGEHVVEPFGDVGVVVEAEHLGVDVLAVERAGQLAAVPLGQAAHGRDLGTRVGRLHHRVDGFLLGRLDEAARVDQDDVRVLSLAPQRPATRREARGKLFRVHLVARATKRDQTYGTGIRHEQRVRDRTPPRVPRDRPNTRHARGRSGASRFRSE